MMDKLKGWLIDVAIKKFGPSAIRGAILGLGGFLAAKSGLLSSFGIVYDQATHILTINLDAISLLAVAGLPAVGAGVIKVLNHQADEAVKTVTNAGQSAANQ
jgi:hypothetical protein